MKNPPIPHTARIVRIFASVVSLTAITHAADFYVSPQGNDANPGTKAQPFATLEKARDTARSTKKSTEHQEATRIWLAGGVYTRSAGFTLDERDSGSPKAPLIFLAQPGTNPRIQLGRPITPAAFQPVSDPAELARLDPAARGEVLRLDLKSLSIQNANAYPNVFRGNGGLFELFQNSQRLKVSRWPNGEFGFTTMKSVIDGGSQEKGKAHGGKFVYRDDRPNRWAAAVKQGVWLAGFWRVPWVIESVRVQEIDTTQQTITFTSPVANGIGSKYTKARADGTRPGDGKEKWYVFNLLEEIDQPGEWCVDFTKQILYLWPTAPLRPNSLLIADRNEPVISLHNASHIQWQGITIECGLGNGVDVNGGEGCSIAGCTMRNLAGRGILIQKGKGHRVQSCDFYDIGLNAIAYSGGDRMTLTPSGYQIINNEIHHAGCYQPTAAIAAGQGDGMIGGAVGVNCVGNLLAHNRIHDCPNAGVYYSGNDNILEYNEIYRIGLNSGDLGGFYSSGGWTSRGNIVRYNFVHHSPAANAIYLDDGDSGDLVIGNVAYQTNSGALLGGGHDNILRGNMIVDCKNGIRIDARGLSRNYTMQDHRLGDDFRSVHPDQDPWHKRYPELLNLLKTDPRIPSGVVIDANLLVSCKITIPTKPAENQGIRLTANLETNSDPGFVNSKALDFQLQPNSRVFSSIPGFHSIPFEKIGLYRDEFRQRIEPRNIDAPLPGRDVFDSATDIKASNEHP